MTCFVVIECDHDGCKATSDWGASTKPEAKRWAKRDGWRVGRTEKDDDLCPEHAA